MGAALYSFLLCYLWLAVVPIEWADGLFHVDAPEVEPAGLGRDHSIYLVKAGEKFIVSCLFRGPRTKDLQAIQWVNEAGSPIESSISVFTQAMYDRNANTLKRSLIFPRIELRDAGAYACRLESSGDGNDFSTKVIHVVVRQGVEWGITANRIGGAVGEPLILDCTASGVPQPTIEITDDKGRELDATIPSLSKEHQGLRIRCVAIQRLVVNGNFNTTTSDVHELAVDVWLPPEFEFNEVERYAVPGQNVSLPCMVLASNPPVEKFSFFTRDNSVVFNHERFTVTQQLDSQMAILRIDHVEEEDFGPYRCEAFNGELKASHTVVLKKTRPPRQPVITVEQMSNSSITWRVREDREYGELPVLSYSIVYRPSTDREEERKAGALLAVGAEDVPQNHVSGGSKGRGIREEKVTTVRERNAAGLYRIAELESNTEYEFLFYARSEAGIGDPTMMRVSISRDGKAAPQSSMATSVPPPALLLEILCSLQLIYIMARGLSALP